jgi:hypothetical protein
MELGLDLGLTLGAAGGGAAVGGLAALALAGWAAGWWGRRPELPGRAAARAWAAEAGAALQDLDEPAFTQLLGGRPVRISVHPRSGHLRARVPARLPGGALTILTWRPGGRELADYGGQRVFALEGGALRPVIDPGGGPPPPLPPGLGGWLAAAGMTWISLGPGGAELGGGLAPGDAAGRRAAEAGLARGVAWIEAAEAQAG